MRRSSVHRWHRSWLGVHQALRVLAGAVARGAEQGDLAAAHDERGTVFIVGIRVTEGLCQHTRVVRTGCLHDGDAAALCLKDLHPAVITDDSVRADESRLAGSNRDAGVLGAEIHDVVVLVVAEPTPRVAQGSVDGEKRIAVRPESASVYPRFSHWSIVDGSSSRGAQAVITAEAPLLVASNQHRHGQLPEDALALERARS